MTPKEKANELFNKIDNVVGGGNYDAKQYALIAVDEIIQSCLETTKLYESNDIINSDLSCQLVGYYEEVKTEINNL
tara:strand:+ start:388 stop:615 length:228 start_codon:yes stop_codon:yes gene_type:complete